MRLRDARISVVDVETTGIDHKTDRICEIGVTTVFFDDEHEVFVVGEKTNQWLINPARPIPPEASAVHHITNNKVMEAPVISDFMAHYGSMDELDPDLFVAHNAPFDRGFFEAEKVSNPETPWLCSLRLAKHLLPGMPSYANQYLRYKLGFETVSGDAHSAGHDALVTACILCTLLNSEQGAGTRVTNRKERPIERFGVNTTVSEVIEYANGPVFLTGELGFGKHADKTWERVRDIDPGYLQWITRQADFDPDKKYTALELLKP